VAKSSKTKSKVNGLEAEVDEEEEEEGERIREPG